MTPPCISGASSDVHRLLPDAGSAGEQSRVRRIGPVSAEIVKGYGAIAVVDCWLDESGPDASSYHGTSARSGSEDYAGFAAAAGAKPGELVALSWTTWPDKSARDEGMERVTADPRMQFEDRPPAFDGRRLIAGGFKPISG